jgi:hypothetical protein
LDFGACLRVFILEAFCTGGLMPRYFFHLYNGDEVEGDPDGMDLPSIEDARTEALRVCRELWEGIPDFFRKGLAFEITDKTGLVLLAVSCADLDRLMN